MVSSDGEEDSSVSRMFDVIEKEVHDVLIAHVVPPPNNQPLSYSFFGNYYDIGNASDIYILLARCTTGRVNIRFYFILFLTGGG